MIIIKHGFDNYDESTSVSERYVKFIIILCVILHYLINETDIIKITDTLPCSTTQY